MLTYLDDRRHGSLYDEERIDIVLLYIDGPKVNDWIQNIYDEYHEKGEWEITFSWFLKELDKNFTDTKREEKAREQIRTMRQKSGESADEFFKCFETVLNAAKLDRNHPTTLDKIEERSMSGSLTSYTPILRESQ